MFLFNIRGSEDMHKQDWTKRDLKDQKLLKFLKNQVNFRCILFADIVLAF